MLTPIFTTLTIVSLFSTLAFLIGVVVAKGRRMKMLRKAGVSYLVSMIAALALGFTLEGLPAKDMQKETAVDSAPVSSASNMTGCEADYEQCANEWEFKRHSHLYYAGKEACKAAATIKAQSYAEKSLRGMTGVIRFGPDAYEQLAYMDWDMLMSEGGIVMKDEEMQIQVYGTSWSPGRSVCSFDFETESVESITVWFD